jgi:hypothetical protein
MGQLPYWKQSEAALPQMMDERGVVQREKIVNLLPQ